MSVANKEEVLENFLLGEVCSRQLLPPMGEPVIRVPIKKRPVSFPDSSAASSMPPLMKSVSLAPKVSVSAEVSFFDTAKQDAIVIIKGKGTIDPQISDHANRSFMLPAASSAGELLDGSNENPSCAEINRSTTQLDESKNQKFSALDLQLASCRHGKNNYGSAVKAEKVDQCFSGFHLAQPHRNVEMVSEINGASNISFGKLPNLDLNVLPDPVDSDEGLPTMYESSKGLYDGLIQHQNAQLPTMSRGLGHNIDRLNLPNLYAPSHKCGPGDVTLDLQLKPPARPEIGKDWIGLAPAPELSLSLSGTRIDEPMALSAPNALFNSEPSLSLKNVFKEAATVGSDKSTVEEALAPVPCKANAQNTSPTVTETHKIVSNLVKKEPEESSLQHNLDDVEKTRLLEHESVGVVKNYAVYEKADSVPRVFGKTQFDLNSNIFPNSSIRDGLGIANNVPMFGPRLSDTAPAEALHVFPEKIQKCVKNEGSTSDVPTPAVATISGHATPMLMAAKSLPSRINVANRATGSCELSIQPPTSLLEPSFCNTVQESPANHLHSHEDMARRTCDALQLQSSSNPISETLIHNSWSYAVNDGTSQGSADMDCSDDDDNTVFRLPTADRPQGGPSSNGLTTEEGINVGNLHKELDNDLHQDCSSVANKDRMGGVNEEEHQGEVFMDEESKENQLLKMDKIFTKNNTDNSIISTHDVKTSTGPCSTDIQMSLDVQNPASSKIGSIKQSPMPLDCCPQKTRGLDIKSETTLSPHGKLTASSSEDFAKNASVKTVCGAEIEEVGNQSGVRPRDSIIGESLGIDDTSNSSCGRVKAAPENSDERSKPDSHLTPSVSNERDGQLGGSHRRDLEYAYVNRNERWEKFMESEREKAEGEYQDGRHGPDMINQRRTDHHYGGRSTGSHGFVRNFRGPRMNNERSFDDDLGHLHRIPYRPRHSPPAVCRRDIGINDGFPGREVSNPRLLARGQMEDLPDDMIQERFVRLNPHRHNAHDDHGFIRGERSHSPAQRRVAPIHFHRGRSPEEMRRSPPERTFLPHRHHTRRHGSPLDRVGPDERGMQRNVRRFGMTGTYRAPEGDAFEPPLHPGHLAGFRAEEEFVDRRKHRDRRVHLRSLEEGPTDDDHDEMLSYHLEEEMEFAECGGGPQEHDGRFRNRMGHRMRGQQEDGCRRRGPPPGWRDADSNDNRPRKRRY